MFPTLRAPSHSCPGTLCSASRPCAPTLAVTWGPRIASPRCLGRGGAARPDRSPDPACPAGWDPRAGGTWKMRPLLQVVAGLLLAAAARGRAMEPGTAAGGETEPGGGGSGVVLSEYFLHPSWDAASCPGHTAPPLCLQGRAGGSWRHGTGHAFPSLTGAGWLQPGCLCAAKAWLTRWTRVAEGGCETAAGCGCCV